MYAKVSVIHKMFALIQINYAKFPQEDKNHGKKNHWKALQKEKKIQFVTGTRRGSPVDRRPSTAEAPPIGKIHPFSKKAVTFEPLMRFWCPSGFRKVLITKTQSIIDYNRL